MKSSIHLAMCVLSTTLTLCCANARAAGGGSMPSSPMPEMREQTPEDKARSSYNDGVRYIRKADDADADAAKADGAKRQKAQDRAAEYYRKALAKFEDAVQQVDVMYQAWNYIGYAKRHLGDYAQALEAYDHALTLKPDYAEAVEYRGHAYLGLDRLDDAKAAYLTLFAANRKLAAQLLTGMQSYVSAKRTNAAATDGASVDAFAKWVDERATIAAQTTALTLEGASTSWH